MTTPERIYRRLLRVYPADFRRDYAEPMAQLFADQLRDSRAAGTMAGPLGLWIRTLLDLATSSISQHLERDRTVAHSAAPLPTVSSRALGIAGMLAGAVLLAPFLVTFEAGWFAPHLIVFNAFVMALAIGMHRRQATASLGLALAATATVVIANGWYLAMTALSMADLNPFGGQFGFIYFLAGIAHWGSAAAYGAATIVIGAFWRWSGALLLIGSVLAGLGMDRLGLVAGDSIFGPLSQVGIPLHGAAWIVLGAELAFRAPRLMRTDGLMPNG
jgi:hypothetical protein